MQKRSQAAIEFIMTYGWAIIVVMVALACLAYFGVFDPSNFTSSKCVLPGAIVCLDFVLLDQGSGNDIVRVSLKNGMDSKHFTNLVFSAEGCLNSSALVPVMQADQILTFDATGCDFLSEKYRGGINLSYTPTTGIPHVAQGILSGKVG